MTIIIDGTTGVPVSPVTGTLAVLNGGTGVTTSTGSGANVLGTSPTLTTPTFDSASLSTISGTAPLYMCRAWVNFNGTVATPSTIYGSGNVSSVTNSATGNYIINFTTAMPDINYSYSIGNGSDASSATYSFLNGTHSGGAKAVGSINIQLFNQTTNVSRTDVCVTIIR